jgi:LPXTG-motif cell wall-anchored protein
MGMLKRFAVLVVAVAGVGVGLAATPAGAQQYPPEDNLLTVSDTTPCPGGAVTITGKNFIPGTQVTISLDDQVIGTPTAGADNTVTLEATIPETTAQGEHLITAIGQGIEEADLHLTATIDVVSCEAGPTTTVASGGGNLPRTGSDSTMMLVRIGLGLAAVGGVLLALAYRKRRHTAAAAV